MTTEPERSRRRLRWLAVILGTLLVVWLLVRVLPIAGLVATRVVVAFLPVKQYTATSLVRVRSHVKSLLEPELKGQLEDKELQRSQETLVKSMLVIEAALEEPKIATLLTIRQRPTDAALWLQDNLKVDFAGDIMRISLSSEREKDVVEIVKAITDAYLTKIGNMDGAKAQSEITTLEELREKYAARLKLKREALSNLTEIIGSNSPEALAELRKELSWATIERQKVEIQHRILQQEAENLRNPAKQEEAAALAQRLEFYTQFEKVLKEQLESQAGEAKEASQSMSRRQMLEDEIRVITQMHDQLAVKLAQLKVDFENKSRRIELIEKPTKAR